MLISARRLVIGYICAKLSEIISNGIKVIERTQFLYRKLQRGIIPQKNVGGVTVFNLCISSGHALYFYQVLVMLYISTKFCEIISNGIKVIERTRFLY